MWHRGCLNTVMQHILKLADDKYLQYLRKQAILQAAMDA
jgi:hypothetical protein